MALIDIHRHLEGSHSPRALAAVARLHRVPALMDPRTGEPATEEALASLSVMPGPAGWDDFVRRVVLTRRAYASLAVIRDLTRLACLEAAAEAGRFEYRFSLYSMTRDLLANQGLAVDAVDDVPFADVHARAVLEAVLAGRDDAGPEMAWRCALRFGISRSFERPGKHAAVGAMVAEYADRLVGIDVLGSGGPGREEALPAELVALVERLRVHLPDLTLHAGELEGPDSVERALALAPDGIGHGVRSVEREALVARLVREGVTLEVCPTSNALLIAPHIERLTRQHGAHPLAVLLQSGVRCVVSTDDPSVFGTHLAREWEAAGEMGVSPEVLARNAEARWAAVTPSRSGARRASPR